MRKDLKLKINFIMICIIFLLSLFILIFVPSISLIGNNYIKINVGEEYKEPGFKTTQLFFNKNDKISIKNNLNNRKIGKYKIIYTLKIGFLKTETTRTVEVVDQEKPIINLKGNSYSCPNKEYVEEGYEAFDNYDGDITDKVNIKKNKNTIDYIVKDSSNNESIVTRTIKIGDVESPKIILNGEENIVLNLGTSYQELGIVVTDNCDSEISTKIVTEGEVNINQVGQYVITYSVTDNFGNKSTSSRTINVVNPYDNPDLNGLGKTIYLTFDDGPSSSITPSLLQILKEENVKATFFVINHDDGLNYLIKQEHDEGHTVALHSFTHDYSYVYSSVDNYFNDLMSIQNKVESITGVKTNIIRFPGGSSNTVSRKYSKGIMTILTNKVSDQGYIYFDWNVSSGDAGGATNSNQVYNSVVNHLVYKNNIVLMHDFEGNYKTLNAIRDIIRFGKEHGYTFAAITSNTFPSHHPVNN